MRVDDYSIFNLKCYRKEKSLQEGQKIICINDVKLIDSGGGFYIEDQLNQNKETEEQKLKEDVSNYFDMKFF